MDGQRFCLLHPQGWQWRQRRPRTGFCLGGDLMARYAIIEDGVVTNLVEASAKFAKSQDWIACPEAGIGWWWDGEQFVPPAPEPIRPDQLLAQIVQATQTRLDAFAQGRNYDGILSACSYATSTVPKFQAEGQYCVQARDATWAALYAILAQVQAGERPLPQGYADLEAQLPILAWPDEVPVTEGET